MAVEKEEGIFNEDDFSLFDEVSNELGMENSSEEEQEEEQEIEDNKAPIVNDEETDDEDEQSQNNEADSDDDSEGKTEEKSEEELEDDGNNEDSSLFTPYAKFLVDEGVLPNLDLENFDGTAEGLAKAQMSEFDNWKEGYKSQLPPEVKRLVDGYEKGVPFDEMLKITSDIIRYENITEESLKDNVGLQKSLTLDYLNQTTKLPDDIKKNMVDQWEDLGELEDKAKLAKGELIGIKNQKEQEFIAGQEQERQNAENVQKQNLQNLEKHILNLDEVIPGIKLNNDMKERVKNNLTKPVEIDQYGYPVNKLTKYMRENPIEGDVVVNYLFEATNGFKDWSVLGKSGKKKAISEFEKAARKLDSGTNVGTGRKKAKGTDPTEGIANFLNF